MPKEPEQPTPEASSHPVLLTGKRTLPFDIDEFLPNHQRRRAWYSFGRPTATEHFSEEQVLTRLPSIQDSVGGGFWKVLMIIVCLLSLLGIVRLGVASFQSSYPGDGKCYLIERWLYEVNSDRLRVEWAIEDAQEEVTNDAEAEGATARIDRMIMDMRTSVAEGEAPEEVAEIQALWLQVLDLILEITEANQKGDSESVSQLSQQRDALIDQREAIETQVLQDCRLAVTVSGLNQVESIRNG